MAPAPTVRRTKSTRMSLCTCRHRARHRCLRPRRSPAPTSNRSRLRTPNVLSGTLESRTPCWAAHQVQPPAAEARRARRVAALREPQGLAMEEAREQAVRRLVRRLAAPWAVEAAVRSPTDPRCGAAVPRLRTPAPLGSWTRTRLLRTQLPTRSSVHDWSSSVFKPASRERNSPKQSHSRMCSLSTHGGLARAPQHAARSDPYETSARVRPCCRAAFKRALAGVSTIERRERRAPVPPLPRDEPVRVLVVAQQDRPRLGQAV
jgi:hypothetical protein